MRGCNAREVYGMCRLVSSFGSWSYIIVVQNDSVLCKAGNQRWSNEDSRGAFRFCCRVCNMAQAFPTLIIDGSRQVGKG